MFTGFTWCLKKKNIQLLFSRKGLCVHAWCTQRWPHIRVIIGRTTWCTHRWPHIRVIIDTTTLVYIEMASH